MKFRYSYPECNMKVIIWLKMVVKYLDFHPDNKCSKICFIIELEPCKLVGRYLEMSLISLRFVIMKYAVVLPYKASENLK